MNFSLALSGGGLLGAAHLGVLHALQDLGVSAQAVAGTSAGGLVASLYALDVPVQDMIQFGRAVCDHPERYFSLDIPGLVDDLFKALGPGASGLINPGKFLDALLDLTPHAHHITQWRRPCALVAADIAQLTPVAFVADLHVQPPAHGHWTVVSDAPLRLALHATMALPGLFAGPRWRHHLYVDGGTVDTLPSDWAYALAPGPVLAVNVAQALPKPARLIGLADTLSRAEYLATSQLSALRELALPVFTLIPDTHGTPFFGFADYHRLVAAGYDAVMTHWPEIERFLLPHSEPG